VALRLGLSPGVLCRVVNCSLCYVAVPMPSRRFRSSLYVLQLTVLPAPRSAVDVHQEGRRLSHYQRVMQNGLPELERVRQALFATLRA
jgi:hypothetical protein